MLGKVVGERARYRILQKSFVSYEAIAVDGLNLRRIEIHRNHTDRNQHAKNDVKDGNARGNGQFQRQSGPMALWGQRENPDSISGNSTVLPAVNSQTDV